MDTTTAQEGKKKIVLMGSAAPDEVYEHAQVIIKTGYSTWIVGPQPYRLVIYMEDVELPGMECPIIDIENVDPLTAADINHKYIHETRGITDVEGYLAAMKEAGAIVEEN